MPLSVNIDPGVLAELSPAPSPELAGRRMDTAVLREHLVRTAARGLNARQAAEALGATYQTVLSIYRDPNFRKRVSGRLAQAFEGVDEATEARILTLHEQMQVKGQIAFDVLVGMLEDHEQRPELRAKIALEFLDRQPDTMAGHIVRHERFDPTALALAAQAATEMDTVVPIDRDRRIA